MNFTSALPIDAALPALRAALVTRVSAVLEAPPGAGKTTRVPLALLDEAWVAGRRIVMLEPRRLAARAAAGFMARQLRESVGDTVGYRIRGDTRVSARTRIEVVTEGVLARLLSADAALESYALVIFDEFHERSLHADLGLALTLETQRHLRPELRILVMSATLDGNAVAGLLDAERAAPVVRSEGRQFPIETMHRAPRAGERLEATVARAVREAVAEREGDVLVFLPGAAEQRRAASRLHGDDVLQRERVAVHTLHGSMPLAAQDAALAAAPPGTRKVVLATSVAETSLTIEGVRTVVDAGLSRLPRYDARVGLTRLETVRVSRASADQRRGRAGRTAPGFCYRLWDVHEEFGFQPRTRPEIVDADLSPLALELADAGVSDPTSLQWLDVPRAGAFAGARELLAQLGALDADGRITAHGRRMSALPVAPRLAHMLVTAHSRGQLQLGAELAALLEERDVLRGSRDEVASDMRTRVELLRRQDGSAAGEIDRDGIARVRQIARELQQRLDGDRGTRRAAAAAQGTPVALAGRTEIEHTGELLALAFPDRVARRRTGSEPRFLLRNGAGATLPKHDALADAEWIAVAELDGAAPEYRVLRAAPMTAADVMEDFATQVITSHDVAWHEGTRGIRATRRRMLGAITIDEVQVNAPDATAVRDAWLAHFESLDLAALPWSKAGIAVRERLAFLHAHDGSWPDVSDEALRSTLGEWLGPQLDGVRKWSELERIDWEHVLLAKLPWERRSALDTLAPTHLTVPSGSRIAIDYSEPTAPVVAVKLQEVFGWTSTPMLLRDRVPVTLHLLSPAQRPVQVTRDLAGFWRTSYFEVRKELRGRYPRHPWPDDPLSAPATRRAKPRGT